MSRDFERNGAEVRHQGPTLDDLCRQVKELYHKCVKADGDNLIRYRKMGRLLKKARKAWLHLGERRGSWENYVEHRIGCSITAARRAKLIADNWDEVKDQGSVEAAMCLIDPVNQTAAQTDEEINREVEAARDESDQETPRQLLDEADPPDEDDADAAAGEAITEQDRPHVVRVVLGEDDVETVQGSLDSIGKTVRALQKRYKDRATADALTKVLDDLEKIRLRTLPKDD